MKGKPFKIKISEVKKRGKNPPPSKVFKDKKNDYDRRKNKKIPD